MCKHFHQKYKKLGWFWWIVANYIPLFKEICIKFQNGDRQISKFCLKFDICKFYFHKIQKILKILNF